MVALLKQCDKIAQIGPESGPFRLGRGIELDSNLSAT
jgi:hypothetical protein